MARVVGIGGTVSVDVKPTHYSLSAVSESFLLPRLECEGRNGRRDGFEIVDADALSTIGTRTGFEYGHHAKGPPGQRDGLQASWPFLRCATPRPGLNPRRRTSSITRTAWISPRQTTCHRVLASACFRFPRKAERWEFAIRFASMPQQHCCPIMLIGFLCFDLAKKSDRWTLMAKT
ncbi:hypothetical protein G5I_01699 [Acromyrmex echinatior]|uniref:Uncharacterized protein n=1 Tax=Acromyrmex echinatior TaxID=103372 RepID=F4W8B8_ACREC|nr:hypothetical protein G5I_01699 [Acromyrmex echinatior]